MGQGMGQRMGSGKNPPRHGRAGATCSFGPEKRKRRDDAHLRGQRRAPIKPAIAQAELRKAVKPVVGAR
jgi:hypothetical protein